MNVTDVGPAPTYPIKCTRCGILYGAGGAVATHNPNGNFCLRLYSGKVSDAFKNDIAVIVKAKVRLPIKIQDLEINFKVGS